MSIRRHLLILAALGLAALAHAQDKARMAEHQQRLAELIGRVASAPTDNERYLASEQTVQALTEALQEDDSHRWRWQLPGYVSVLTSPDGHLRLFTWAVIRDNGEFECFGIVQFYNEREEEYQFATLHDRSDDLLNREESLLTPDNWLGAVYQEIIQVSTSDRTWYTLLGWNGVDNLTDRKVIEPVTIRGGKVQFGGPLFRRERNLRRIVLEYANEASVHLAYETQYVQEIERVREKVKGTNRHRTVEKVHEHKEQLIIFDEVEPQVPGMEGLFQYYMPSGTELAYAFVDGKWEQRKGAQGRLTDKKLNKEFEPLPKNSPNYQFDNQKNTK